MITYGFVKNWVRRIYPADNPDMLDGNDEATEQ